MVFSLGLYCLLGYCLIPPQLVLLLALKLRHPRNTVQPIFHVLFVDSLIRPLVLICINQYDAELSKTLSDLLLSAPDVAAHPFKLGVGIRHIQLFARQINRRSSNDRGSK